MGPPSRRTAPAAMALLAVLAGCGHSATRPSGALAPPPPCRSAAPAVGPHFITGTLTERDNGAAICAKVGDTLAVFLHPAAGASASRWSPPALSGSSVLGFRPLTSLTLPVGVTGALVAAQRKGVAGVSSRRDGSSWRVTIVVR